jgi:hypothetical protein
MAKASSKLINVSGSLQEGEVLAVIRSLNHFEPLSD